MYAPEILSQYLAGSKRRRNDPEDYLANLSHQLGRYPHELPAAATELAIRGNTPAMNSPAAATENLIRGLQKPVQGHGGMFYNTLLRGK